MTFFEFMEKIFEKFERQPIIYIGCLLLTIVTIHAVVRNDGNLVEQILIAVISFLFGTATAIKSAQKKSFRKKEVNTND